jgi:hypothetical protein
MWFLYYLLPFYKANLRPCIIFIEIRLCKRTVLLFLLIGAFMHIHSKFLFAGASAIALMSASVALAADNAAAMDKPAVERVTTDWPKMVKDAIAKTTQKYGQPDEVTATMVKWNNPGAPFKRIEIQKQEIPHNFPMPHTDFLKEVVSYQVPADEADDLTAYDGSVTFSRTKGEMAAQCDMEELNILALNLAHDIVTGKRSVDEARQFYGQTAMAFKKGEKPEYTQRLMFDTKGNAADPDQKL